MVTPKFPTPNELIEGPLDRAVDLVTGIVNLVVDSPPGVIYNMVRAVVPALQETRIDTPFGSVRAPEIGLPDLKRLVLDPRKRDAVKAAIAIDASGVVGLIPGVGDIAADVAEDTYGARLRQLLTTQEMNQYTRFDKLGPSTIAVVRTFMRESMEK